MKLFQEISVIALGRSGSVNKYMCLKSIDNNSYCVVAQHFLEENRPKGKNPEYDELQNQQFCYYIERIQAAEADGGIEKSFEFFKTIDEAIRQFEKDFDD